MRPWNFRKYFSLISEVYWWNRFHFWWWVLLNRAPTSIQFHPPPPSSFHPQPCSLQHPQQYLNLNNVRNWANSPNLSRKIKSYPFWLKIGTHGILEVLIPNPDYDFWNSDPKSIFGQIWTQKFKDNWCKYLKDTDSESGLRFLKFRPQNPFLGKFWSKKSQLFVFPENWHAWHLDDADSYSHNSFLNCQP